METIEDQYSAIPVSERDKVYGILQNMKHGEVLPLEKIKPENRTKFIIIVKYYIRWVDSRFDIAEKEDKISKQ